MLTDAGIFIIPLELEFCTVRVEVEILAPDNRMRQCAKIPGRQGAVTSESRLLFQRSALTSAFTFAFINA